MILRFLDFQVKITAVARVIIEDVHLKKKQPTCTCKFELDLGVVFVCLRGRGYSFRITVSMYKYFAFGVYC